uniref:CW-type domain-containing protein n=1 Tax=Hanusia phi TaxID=3032 RepID=A0A7S0ECP7_9CRYP|mmetsp:Transcript_21725/g.49191  ORF Transcript_21725/g.49191 Transcript_21725/m.49191 type:complete len:287 (+) Transcript_21725:388-1248(+)
MPAALDLDLGMDPRRKNFFCNYCGYETYWSPAFSRHEKECQWKKILDGKEDSIPQNSSCPPASHVGRETMIGVGQLQQEGFDKKRTIPPPVLPQSIYDVPPASWEVQLAKAQLEAEAVEDSECTADSSSDFASNHAEKLGKLDLRCSLKHESRMDFKKMKSVYCSVKKSKKKKNAMLMYRPWFHSYFAKNYISLPQDVCMKDLRRFRKEVKASMVLEPKHSAARKKLKKREMKRVDPEEQKKQTWIRCDSCMKWRRIPPHVEIDTENSFFCGMLKGMTCSMVRRKL